MTDTPAVSAPKRTGYAPINGLTMYYEITGQGEPLIFVPAAFASSGIVELPQLARCWRVIQVDLQGHGRTADIDRPLSFEQHARDIVALMDHLQIERAHFFGWSYGGLIATLIALHSPERVNRVATYGSLFCTPEQGIRSDKLGPVVEQGPFDDAHRFARDHYCRVAPDPDHWPAIWAKLMALSPEGFSREQLGKLRNRYLIALGDNDFVRLDHAIEVYSAIPQAELAVVPDASHFLPYDRPEILEPVLSRFFSSPDARVPFGTIATGYRPGVTR